MAAADTTGDGVPEIITGAGPSGGPHVRVIEFNGGALRELASFYAYDAAFAGGVFVAGGDVDGDGLAEVITGAGPSAGPHVRAFSLAGGTPTEVASFFAYDPAFAGGVSVAAGDVTGDGVAEIITGAGPGGGPHVRAFSLAGGGVTEVASFFAYDRAFTGAVHVAAADLTGDGVAEIITGAGPGGSPHVRAFGVAGGVTEVASFFAYNPAFGGGVYVAAAATPRGEVAMAAARIIDSLAYGLANPSPVALMQLACSSPALRYLSPNGGRRHTSRASTPRHFDPPVLEETKKRRFPV